MHFLIRYRALILRRCFPFIACGWLGAIPAARGAVSSYTIVDLGAFQAGDSVQADAINDSGTVVGTESAITTFKGFAWNGALHALPALAGDADSGANAINSPGWVVGQSFNEGGAQQATLWVNGVPSLLPVAATYVNPLGINTAGSVVGSTGTGANMQAFLLPAGAGSSTNLGTLGGSSAVAYAINDAGTVVGSADTANGNSHAFIWQSGKMTQLSDLGLSGAAYCINQQGLAGGFVLRSNFTLEAALWSANGTLTGLPGLAGSADAEVWSVNQNSQAVGDADGHAVLWSGGSAQSLLSLIPANSGWNTLNYAYGINDSGDIVGWGTRDSTGTDHAFLLVPVPEPGNLLGLGTVLGLLWRRGKLRGCLAGNGRRSTLDRDGSFAGLHHSSG